jgi:hypothetical protein
MLHRYIRQAKPDAGFQLFEIEILKAPSFVEVDDVNGKILIYSDQDRFAILSSFSKARASSLSKTMTILLI